MTIDWQQEVEARKDEMLQKIRAFLRIRSVEDLENGRPGAPFGDGVAQALEYILNEAASAGFTTKNLDGYAGHAEMGTGEELVGILCHVDVVPEGTGWTTPPYDPTIRNGRLYARGAVDDKGPTMAALFAARIVKELGLPLSRRVRLIFGANEETGWKCVKHYFAHEEMPTLGFAPDADFPIIYAEKGIMDVQLQLPKEHTVEGEESLSPTLVQFQAGYRSNMVPEHATARLIGEAAQLAEVKNAFMQFSTTKSLKGEGELGEGGLTLRLEGKAAHGSMPELGINAGVMLAHFLQEQVAGRGQAWLAFIDRYLYEDTAGSRLGIAMADEISGALTCNAGVLQYEQGEENRVVLNLRYPVSFQGEVVLKKMRDQLQGEEVEVHLLTDQPPHHVDADDELVTTLQRVYEEQTGEPATLLAIGGGTYARVLQRGVAFGPVFPGGADVAHQRDEYIEIDDLIRATAIYAQAIYELAR